MLGLRSSQSGRKNMSLVFKRESAYGPVVLEKLGEGVPGLRAVPTGGIGVGTSGGSGNGGGSGGRGQKEGKGHQSRTDTASSTLPIEVSSMDVISGVSSDGISMASGKFGSKRVVTGNTSGNRRLDGKRPKPVQTQVREWKRPPVSGSGLSRYVSQFRAKEEGRGETRCAFEAGTSILHVFSGKKMSGAPNVPGLAWSNT